jgi:hypothetical protein
LTETGIKVKKLYSLLAKKEHERGEREEGRKWERMKEKKRWRD